MVPESATPFLGHPRGRPPLGQRFFDLSGGLLQGILAATGVSLFALGTFTPRELLERGLVRRGQFPAACL